MHTAPRYTPRSPWQGATPAEEAAQETLDAVETLIAEAKAFIARRAKELRLEFDAPTATRPATVSDFVDELLREELHGTIRDAKQVVEA